MKWQVPLHGNETVVQILLTIRDENTGRERLEKHSVTGHDPYIWAKRQEHDYNKWADETGRGKAKIIKIDTISEITKTDEHIWVKNELLSSAYRTPYKCLSCGLTGKREGFNNYIVIDSKYRRIRFLKCGEFVE